MKFKFKRKKLELQRAYYEDMHLALVAVNQKTHKVDYVLTVNLPDFNFPEEEIALKTWGQNKNIAQIIFNLGLFEDTSKRGSNGVNTVEFWKLLDGFDISNIPLMKE